MARKTPKKAHDQKTADGHKGGKPPKMPVPPAMPVADMKMPPRGK